MKTGAPCTSRLGYTFRQLLVILIAASLAIPLVEAAPAKRQATRHAAPVTSKAKPPAKKRLTAKPAPKPRALTKLKAAKAKLALKPQPPRKDTRQQALSKRNTKPLLVRPANARKPVASKPLQPTKANPPTVPARPAEVRLKMTRAVEIPKSTRARSLAGGLQHARYTLPAAIKIEAWPLPPPDASRTLCLSEGQLILSSHCQTQAEVGDANAPAKNSRPPSTTGG